MKKFSMAALVVALFFSLIQTQPHIVHASGEGIESFTIPKETSTTEAVKTYEFKYPAGVDRILGTGYNISGGGTIEAYNRISFRSNSDAECFCTKGSRLP